MPRNAGPRKTAHVVGGCREHVAPIRGAREDAHRRRDGSAPRDRAEPCRCPSWHPPPLLPPVAAARRCAASFSYIRVCHMRMADAPECSRPCDLGGRSGHETEGAAAGFGPVVAGLKTQRGRRRPATSKLQRAMVAEARLGLTGPPPQPDHAPANVNRSRSNRTGRRRRSG